MASGKKGTRRSGARSRTNFRSASESKSFIRGYHDYDYRMGPPNWWLRDHIEMERHTSRYADLKETRNAT